MATATARRLRANQTDVEKRLWARLRNRGLLGLKFRRQVPLGDFVADFVCTDHALVVELDGGQHASSEISDDRRTVWLEARDWRFIRFWNNEVNENLDGVLTVIARIFGLNPDEAQPALDRRPHPDPLPEGEGEVRSALPRGEGEARTSPGRSRRMLSRGFAPGGRG
jgi:very-short-patch-repair endonuclease